MAEERIVLKIKGEDYPLPENITVKQFREANKAIEFEDIVNTKDSEYIDAAVKFYQTLLKDEYPELKKADFEAMPMYQLGLEFMLMVKAQVVSIPLGSRPEREKVEEG